MQKDKRSQVTPSLIVYHFSQESLLRMFIQSQTQDSNFLSQSQPKEYSKFKKEMEGLFNFQRHFWIFTSDTTLPREDNVTLGGVN